MVRTTTVSQRFAALLAMVPGLAFGEVDRLAGRKSEGHARQIAVGGKTPKVATLRRYAPILGASLAWLALGEGDAPVADVVQAAVAAARSARGKRRHRSKVVTDRAPSTAGARSAAKRRGAAR